MQLQVGIGLDSVVKNGYNLDIEIKGVIFKTSLDF